MPAPVEPNYDEAKVPPYELPDLMRLSTGSRVTTIEQWASRRAEIIELFREHVFGRSPGKPERLRFELIEEDPVAMDGAATLKRIAIHSRHGPRSHRFEVVLFLPNASREPVPVFLLINNRSTSHIDPTRAVRSDFWPAEMLVARGYGAAAFNYGELAPDDPDRFGEGVIQLFEGDADSRPPNAWGAPAAWAWGASRALDYFETEPRVNADRVAVVGHSRGGKTALWASSEDPRFALTISNNSGCGGAALSRRWFGETVALINHRFPHWFCGNFKNYNDRENDLPIDQHMLLALIAPRALYVTSATDDHWADPTGEFLSLVHASPAYALWGHAPVAFEQSPPADASLVVPPRAYHIRTGKHGMKLFDWNRFVDFRDLHNV